MTLATCVSAIAGIVPASAAPVLDRQDRDTDWRRVATVADRGRLERLAGRLG
ncbi:hypothetical protein NHF48_021395 [Sphingomonas sp. H160509]|uniref:hypothetical protein n=1 Tax=Sphingomonas sp. H160509 TaxID=2955313 RepID=UPI002097731E|nr:hypothetical protein [Sphingomonas sp. H160509]MDD1452901.1 hypothetical protein [Sphingomonas sp. H160509]